MEKLFEYQICPPYDGCKTYEIYGEWTIRKDVVKKSRLLIHADNKDEAVKQFHYFKMGNIFKCDLRSLKLVEKDNHGKEDNQQGDIEHP